MPLPRPSLHPAETALAGIVIALLPQAGFCLAGYPWRGAVYAVLFGAMMIACEAISWYLTVRRLRVFMRDCRAFERRIVELMAEGKTFEAGQVFVEWHDYMDRRRSDFF